MISNAAEKTFRQHGKLVPCLFFVDRKGDYVMVPAPSQNKDISNSVFRAALELEGATRCVFCDEAWGVKSDTETEARAVSDYARDNSLGNIPGREEVVIFMCEDAREGTKFMRRAIIRPANGKPHLGPLEDFELGTMEGRLVGMLPKPETERTH